MPTYSYVAINDQGSKHKGVLQSDSERSARQSLREQGLTPVELKESKHTQKNTPSLGFRKAHLKTYDLSLVTRQLGTMIQAGLPLDEALAAAAEQTEKRKIRSLLLALRGQIMEGHSLATAMAEYPHAFPNMYRSTVAAGERTGHLGMVMNRLADHTEASAEFQQKVGTALVYPILLVFVSILIVTGLMIYVVPDVIEVFVDAGQELPVLTQALMNISEFISQSGIWLLAAVCFAIVAGQFVVKLEQINLFFDRLALKTFFIRKFSRGYNSARYVSTLFILNSSGVPLVEAMEIAMKVVPNRYLSKRLEIATTRVKEGVSLSKALLEVGFFPPIMVHMIASGETSGELDTMLSRTASNQEKELQRWVSTVISLFEPATLLIMGGVVMLIVIAILLPILNMNQLVV